MILGKSYPCATARQTFLYVRLRACKIRWKRNNENVIPWRVRYFLSGSINLCKRHYKIGWCNIDIVYFLYSYFYFEFQYLDLYCRWNIQLQGIGAIKLFTLFLRYTSSHTHLAVISNKGSFLFLHQMTVNMTRQFFFIKIHYINLKLVNCKMDRKS